MTCIQRSLSPVWRLAAAGALCVLAACGSGSETSPAENPDPGGGGGPGGPAGTGNPLAIALEFSVRNESTQDRTETIRATVPFPQGGYTPDDLDNMVVSGHQTAWMPMQFWPDGRVKIAQAQFTDEVEAGEIKNYVVTRDEPSLTGAFQQNAWVAQASGDLEFGTEVRDTFDVPYRGFASGSGEVLQTSPLVQVKRYRTYHQPVGATGIGRDYLSSTYYVTEFRDMPFVVVDWILGNDYLGADDVPAGNTDPNLEVLGTVDVRGAFFLCRGATAIERYRPIDDVIEEGVSMGGGYTGFRVMQNTFLADAQTRRYRFMLRFEPGGASQADLERWRNTAEAMMEHPMYGLATQPAWELTGAAGLVGGPVRGPDNAPMRARAEYDSWRNTPSNFGTWGSRGDQKATATTGTPRNHPLSPELAHAIQGQLHPLLIKLEQMAWAQAMRPYHLWQLEVGAEQQILLWAGTPYLLVSGESLGRRAIANSDPHPQYRTLSEGVHPAHEWEPFDHEHWSTDLLFDYWTMSGDEWAKEELRQLGQSLKGIMRLVYYYTSGTQAARAEGWCMQGWVQVYLATRDESIRDYAMRRVNEIIEVQRHKDHPSKALVFNGNYTATFYPFNHEFFMPWHHGGVLFGYLAAYRYFGDPVLLEICEDVVDTVEYSWVSNMNNHPRFGFIAEGLRYYTPVTHNGTSVPADYWDNLSIGAHMGDSPLGGAHTFLIGGLHLLANATNDSDVRMRALQYGAILRGPAALSDNARWNKWWYCIPSNYADP